MMPKMNFKKLTDSMIVPTKAHPTDACFDLYADVKPYGEVAVVPPHQVVKIHTGFATNIPSGYWGAIFARSGMATKNGLRLANGVAVIDENYTGEWIVALYNDSDETQMITHGDRIAQFMIVPYYETRLIEVEELAETDRGANGFGSTGS